MEETKSKSNKLYLIIIIIILLILNVIFMYNFFTTDKKLVVTEEQLVSTDNARQELEKLLGETESQLNQYKGQNVKLDQMLKEKNDSLQDLAERIESILKKGKITQKELSRARDELDVLRYYKQKYLRQIDSMAMVNRRLVEENQTLQMNVDSQKRKVEDLTMQNLRLNNKVSIGAKLFVQNIFITGVKLRSNGKERETIRASQMEALKVSFTILENYVSEKGDKDIYLRIANADGTPAFAEETSANIFKFQGKDELYSVMKTIKFENTQQDVIIYWNKGSDFKKGDYKAELYSDGFLIGVKEFEIK
jgi:DNA repair ATPase RecN